MVSIIAGIAAGGLLVMYLMRRRSRLNAGDE
jgi:hypothetical protein